MLLHVGKESHSLWVWRTVTHNEHTRAEVAVGDNSHPDAHRTRWLHTPPYQAPPLKIHVQFLARVLARLERFEVFCHISDFIYQDIKFDLFLFIFFGGRGGGWRIHTKWDTIVRWNEMLSSTHKFLSLCRDCPSCPIGTTTSKSVAWKCSFALTRRS